MAGRNPVRFVGNVAQFHVLVGLPSVMFLQNWWAFNGRRVNLDNMTFLQLLRSSGWCKPTPALAVMHDHCRFMEPTIARLLLADIYNQKCIIGV